MQRLHSVLVSEKIDLRDMPMPRPTIHKDHLVVKGDLHANTLTLIVFLIKENIIEMSQENFKIFSDLYSKYSETQQKISAQDMKEFARVINETQVVSSRKIIFLGDEVADRQLDDFLTILVFFKLKKDKACYKIILSNHGLSFLHAYLNNFSIKKEQQGDTVKISMEHANGIKNPLMRNSLDHLAGLLDESNKDTDLAYVDAKIFKEMVDYCYIPHLEVLSSSVVVPQFADQKYIFNIFTHGVVGFNIIDRLAEKFNVACKNNADRLYSKMLSIERVNASFQDNIKHWLKYLIFYYNTCWSIDYKRHGYEGLHPFASVIDARLVVDEKELQTISDNGEFFINRVHGHDIDDKGKPGVVNLDGYLGKSLGSYVGLYEAFFTYDCDFTDLYEYYISITKERIDKAINTSKKWDFLLANKMVEQVINSDKKLILAIKLNQTDEYEIEPSDPESELIFERVYDVYTSVKKMWRWVEIIDDLYSLHKACSELCKDDECDLEKTFLSSSLQKIDGLISVLIKSNNMFDEDINEYIIQINQIYLTLEKKGIDVAVNCFVEESDNVEQKKVDESVDMDEDEAINRVISSSPSSLFSQSSKVAESSMNSATVPQEKTEEVINQLVSSPTFPLFSQPSQVAESSMNSEDVNTKKRERAEPGKESAAKRTKLL